jgi:hypothetical protein
VTGAAQARVQLVQAENVIREAGVRIQNGERHIQALMQQRAQAQQHLERMQTQAQRGMAMMASRGRGSGMYR